MRLPKWRFALVILTGLLCAVALARLLPAPDPLVSATLADLKELGNWTEQETRVKAVVAVGKRELLLAELRAEINRPQPVEGAIRAIGWCKDNSDETIARLIEIISQPPARDPEPELVRVIRQVAGVSALCDINTLPKQHLPAIRHLRTSVDPLIFARLYRLMRNHEHSMGGEVQETATQWKSIRTPYDRCMIAREITLCHKPDEAMIDLLREFLSEPDREAKSLDLWDELRATAAIGLLIHAPDTLDRRQVWSLVLKGANSKQPGVRRDIISLFGDTRLDLPQVRELVQKRLVESKGIESLTVARAARSLEIDRERFLVVAGELIRGRTVDGLTALHALADEAPDGQPIVRELVETVESKETEHALLALLVLRNTTINDHFRSRIQSATEKSENPYIRAIAESILSKPN